jgi:hypothetical protein
VLVSGWQQAVTLLPPEVAACIHFCDVPVAAAQLTRRRVGESAGAGPFTGRIARTDDASHFAGLGPDVLVVARLCVGPDVAAPHSFLRDVPPGSNSKQRRGPSCPRNN